MSSSDRIALAGVLVMFVLGAATFYLQRKENRTQIAMQRAQAESSRQAVENGLIDQIQEDRRDAWQRNKDITGDLSSCQTMLRQALEDNNVLRDHIRDLTRTNLELTDSRNRLDAEANQRHKDGDQ